MLAFFLISFISYQTHFACAAAVAGDGDTGGEVATVGWQSSPRTRGTWSILISCLITLTLCAYTAIHPNVPKQGSTYSDFLWTRTKWVMVGILAPELVVYTAWRQWTSARHLNTELTKSKGERAVSMVGSAGPSFLGNWSMVQSYFVEMGGYVIERKGERNVTLTTKGVIRMVELGYKLPRLAQEDIQDRSKADPITKVITCAQAGYMIAQVIGRRAADLPITMLEINTLGHAVCALAMFAFWFRKPMNIEVPVLMDEEWLNKQQQRITQQTQGFWSPAFWKRPREHQAKLHRYTGSLTDNVTIREDNLFLVFLERLRELKLFDHVVQANPEEALRAEIRPGPPALNEPWKPTDVVLIVVGIDLSDLEDSPNNIYSTLKDTNLWRWLATSIFHCPEDLSSLWPSHATTLCLGQALQLYLTLDDVIKWDRAWTSFVAAGSLNSAEAWSEWKVDFDSQAQASQYTCFRAQNWPTDTGRLQTGHRLVGISILSLATGFYGGLHLLLWSAYFPSKAERDLWRICSSTIAVSGIIAGYLVLLVSDEHDPLPRYLKPIMWPFQQAILLLAVLVGSDKVVKVSAQVTLLVACIVGPCYVAARAYIIVECFLSLRRLPVDAYTVPLWSQFWPHV
jgi:hypothetical protein